MADWTHFFARQWPLLQEADLYLPRPNPTFRNPAFDAAGFRVLIVRLSPFRDVDRSTPHLFLFQEARRAVPRAYIDVAFLPPRHDRRRLEQAGVPLIVGSQSFHSIEDFDLVLISNAYTLELVNLPYLLLCSGVPLFASQRDSTWPMLILGGSNVMAASSVVSESGDSLVDAFFFGEGERQVEQLVRCLNENADLDKAARLMHVASQVQGLWVTGEWPAQPVEKAMLHTPDSSDVLVDYPLLNSTQAGTARLQINYGCPAFCSFCFEAYDRRPYREMPLDAILETARRLKRDQGASTLELYGFNFNTHQDILTLLPRLSRLFDRVGFKSQRADVLLETPDLLEAQVAAGKRTFTLGVEGISVRMRAWLHKSLAAADVLAVAERLLQSKVREIKLFYILTGHESEEDRVEFRGFVKALKERRLCHSRGTRIIFSFGLLVRMPATPLQYDRLFLDEDAWRGIIGPVKSACETNGFEFRLAGEWEETCTAQVLALGGYWLVEPLMALAAQSHCYDEHLTSGYWEQLRAWMVDHGRWGPSLLDEKGPDDPFPFSFVRSNVPSDFGYQQYRQARAGIDDGYCLGREQGPGRCLRCEACLDTEQRRAITMHRVRPPDGARASAVLSALVRDKSRLRPVYARLRVPEWVAGTTPEWMNACALRDLLAAHPSQTDNLLTAQESLFTTRENVRRFAGFFGETVFALTAWDPQALLGALDAGQGEDRAGVQFLSLENDFEPGGFRRLTVTLSLPVTEFPDAGQRLRDFLRDGHIPCNLRREGAHHIFDLPAKALKKKALFEGEYEQDGDRFVARLVVGPRFDLLGYLRSFDHPDHYRLARAGISDLIV